MVDTGRSRRDTPFKCYYWKRNVNDFGDNDTLINNNLADGLFYAKIIEDRNADAQDIANSWQIEYNNITIKTYDYVNISKNDLVKFRDKIWIVERTSTRDIQKNCYYGKSNSKETIIVMQNGC